MLYKVQYFLFTFAPKLVFYFQKKLKKLLIYKLQIFIMLNIENIKSQMRKGFLEYILTKTPLNKLSQISI